MNTKKLKSAFTLVEVCIILVIVGLLIAMIGGTYFSVKLKYSQEAYVSWCKLSGRTDFTYEEWKAARRAGLLDAASKSYPAPVVVPVRSR